MREKADYSYYGEVRWTDTMVDAGKSHSDSTDIRMGHHASSTACATCFGSCVRVNILRDGMKENSQNDAKNRK